MLHFLKVLLKYFSLTIDFNIKGTEKKSYFEEKKEEN